MRERLRATLAAILPRSLMFSAAILWMECAVRIWSFGSVFGRGLVYTLLFSVAAGLLCACVCSLWAERGNRRAAVVIVSFLTLWYMVQAVYFKIFRTFLVLDSLSMAGDAVGNYWREMFTGIWKSLPVLLPMLVPLIATCVCSSRLRERFVKRAGRREAGRERIFARLSRCAAASLLAASLTVQCAAAAVVQGAGGSGISPRELYRGELLPDLMVPNFGVLTTLRLDFERTVFGDSMKELLRVPEPPATPITTPAPTPTRTPAPATETKTPEVTPEPTPTPVVYEPNMLDIDFAALTESDPQLAGMHEWFASREPTMQNEYTGMFEGKNLLFFTAEGFWRYAVNEKYTPTLYKLANEGFVFNNFYNPLWWKSTTDGEYVACTGLIPSASVRSFKRSGSNSMPFCMGNQLRAEGYVTTAYHNHTYTYYNRDISHPNMGYDYYGLGKGLDVVRSWPESDLEMMEKTLPQALAGEKPFHNYYMTVSGHMNYSFGGNAMAYKHRDEVADLDMSEEARAYLACNMELDRALEYTLEQLELAGELENTVICISGDHYPYGMSPDTWNEFYGGEIDRDFELMHSSLIIWSGDMEEPIVVDKPCSSLDIIPTLSNLFGLDYDSRLLAGRDILSTSPGLVVLSNRSFITEYGRYNARTDTWTPADGVETPEGYVAETFSEVRELFKYSVKILENDYYRRIGIAEMLG